MKYNSVVYPGAGVVAPSDSKVVFCPGAGVVTSP